MPISEDTLKYGEDAIALIGHPRAFIEACDFDSSEERKKSWKALTFGLLLTTVLLLVQLNFLPPDLSASLKDIFKKEESLFSYSVVVLIFAVVIHLVCVAVRGRGEFWSTVAGVSRIYAILFPFSTIILGLVTQAASRVLQTDWILIPPLGVRAVAPVGLRTVNAAWVSAVMTVQAELVILCFFCTVLVVRRTHKLSWTLTVASTGVAIGVMHLLRNPIGEVSRWVYVALEPLIKIFL